MENPNPIYVGLLFIIRCLVPLLILFGISYILRRLGLIVDPSTTTEDSESKDQPSKGGAAHGSK